MNKKLKTGNAVVIAILVVLVIGLIIALTITITSLAKINNANKDGDSNTNTNNGVVDDTNKDNNKLPSEESNKKDDEDKFDPYANYKDLVWDTGYLVQSDIGLEYKIYEGCFFYKDTRNGKNEGRLIDEIDGSPSLLKGATIGGAFGVYLLTSENKIYRAIDGDEIELYVDLSKYEIVDMTLVNGELYYLTKDGNLIDKNGVKYDKTSNPYANYANMVFAIDTTKEVVELDVITWDGKYKVEDGVLYFTSNSTGKTTKVEGISGKVTKIIKGMNGGGDQIAILTDKVIAYIVFEDEIETDLKKDLSKYNVIDMTYVNKNGGLYFLTKDGNLIDKNGLKYNG